MCSKMLLRKNPYYTLCISKDNNWIISDFDNSLDGNKWNIDTE